MRPTVPLAVTLAVLASFPTRADPARAEEDNDLNFIPSLSTPTTNSTPQAAPSRKADATMRIYVEDVFAATALRNNLVVALPPNYPKIDWQNRTSLDIQYVEQITDNLRVMVSDRVDIREENDFSFPSQHTLTNNWREGYISWEPSDQIFLELGRINLRNGAALGYNPTDFFKSRTALSQTSLDPSAMRKNRLGTVMVRVQKIYSGGSLSIAYAPKLSQETAIPLTYASGIDPGLDRTNGTGRLLVTGSIDLAGGVSPELLYTHSGGEDKVGLNLSCALGSSFVVYGEWAGGNEAGLVSQAEAFGISTGSLPSYTSDLLSEDGGKSFKNDLVLGGSWTSEGNVTINLEYHYHQAGLSRQEWNRWFDTGVDTPSLSSALWKLRSYAADQQDPMTRHQAFIRANWPDAFVRDLELSGFALVNLYDGSVLAQVSAQYHLSDTWTVDLVGYANLGAPRSEYGSLPQAQSVILQVIHYF